MFHHKHKNALMISLQASVALGSLVALSGTAAHAGVIQFNPLTGTSAQISGGVTTAPYSLGDPATGYLPSPYLTTAGSTNITFKTTAVGPEQMFETFQNDGHLDFPVGTNLLDSFDSKTTHNPNGPVEIDFNSGVGAFGLQAQSARVDVYSFTFSVYDASNILLGTFTTPTVVNNVNPGKSVFIGAESTVGPEITKVIISSFSTAVGIKPNNGSNDFYSGPLTVGAAVPEASTMTGFGLGTLLFGGLILVSRKRKSTQTL